MGGMKTRFYDENEYSLEEYLSITNIFERCKRSHEKSNKSIQWSKQQLDGKWA